MQNNEMIRDLEHIKMIDPALGANGYVRNFPKSIVVHHTGGTDANPKADTSHHTFEIVNDWHKQAFNYKSSLGFYIGYHYFIDKAGKVKQGRADYEAGAHTIGENTRSIGVCLAGNFDVTEPTPEQVASLRSLLKSLMVSSDIPASAIYPHRHFAKKSCYGNKLSDDWASKLALETDKEDIKAEALALVVEIREKTDRLEDLIEKL